MRARIIGILIVLLIALWGAKEAWRGARKAPEPVVAPPPVVQPAAEAPVAKPVTRPPPLPPSVPVVKPVQKKPAGPAPAKAPVTQSASRPALPEVRVFVKPGVPVLPPPPPVPQHWQGNDSVVTHSGQVVIRNDRQWIQFWSEHRPHEAAPEVDFSRQMVVGVFAGPRPADQFSIEMTRFETLADKLLISYREQTPPPGTLAVNVTVYPYDIRVIPKATLPVKFKALSGQEKLR